MTAIAEASGIAPEQRTTLSRTFLALAWTIEIAAAGVGITIAISRLYDPVTGDVGIDGILAALPFFAVAIMELTKIPIATVIYHTAAKRWRYGFTIALVLSMVITFETFVMGFDIYQAQLETQIKPTKDAVKELKLKIASTEENIIASDAISKGTAEIENEHKNILASVHNKYDKMIEAYEDEKKAIEKKYEGFAPAIEGIVASHEAQLKDLDKQIQAERKAERKDLDDLAEESGDFNKRSIGIIEGAIERLQREKEQIRKNNLRERNQVRGKAEADYKECQKADAESFWGKPCDELQGIERGEIKIIDERESKFLKDIDDDINRQRQKLSDASIGGDAAKEDAIRARYGTRINDIQSRKHDINEKIAKRREEIARKTGKKGKVDKDALARLDGKITNANDKREKDVGAATKVHKKKSDQITTAKTAVVDFVTKANKLREELAPKCAELNNVVMSNQVYRLAIQFHDVDDACKLTQEQLTWTQWIWFGSLALVTSALGTTLAFASLVIKYPPKSPSGGEIGGMVKGLFRRVNYTLALLHRRLRKPKIKKVLVEKKIIKEVIKEVTKEVPVEKVVYRDVPREVVKKELVHVPLFTQDVKAVVKGD